MTTFPPLTVEDLNGGYVHPATGIVLVDDEDGRWVFSLGHIDPDVYADAIRWLWRTECGCDDEVIDLREVEHKWAVVEDPPPEWWIRWNTLRDGSPITKDTPGAFPVTTVAL